MRNTDGLKRGGNRGRPKGTPNKATLEMKEFAQSVLLEDPAYVKSLQRRLRRGKAPHMETLLAHYGYGKPIERVAVGAASDFDKMTEAELVAYIMAAMPTLKAP